MPVRDDAERLKHDLGKYVSFSARWLAEDASEGDLRTALLDDLRRTRRGPSGAEGLRELWAQLGPPLRSVAGFDALEAEVNSLVARADQLESADLEELRRTSDAARALSDHIRRFTRAAAEA